MAKILLMSLGSRGDMEPFLALGEELIEQGLGELTAEHLVVKYSYEFSKEVVVAAEQKLISDS